MQSIIFTNGMILLVKAWILEVFREIAHKMRKYTWMFTKTLLNSKLHLMHIISYLNRGNRNVDNVSYFKCICRKRRIKCDCSNFRVSEKNSVSWLT